jgi:uncharacterized protein YjlB
MAPKTIMPVRPEKEIDFDHLQLEDDGTFPNNPELALLYYPGAVIPQQPDPAATFEVLFEAHGWVHSWRDSIYDFHHYHSTAHEVLGIYQGQAQVRFGGEKSGITIPVRTGDVVVIPAGVSHKNLGSSNLGVVGAYPRGQQYDMNYGKAGERPKADYRITAVAMPQEDPLYGPEGPLVRLWVEGEYERME